jgi:hypothetical protein
MEQGYDERWENTCLSLNTNKGCMLPDELAESYERGLKEKKKSASRCTPNSESNH